MHQVATLPGRSRFAWDEDRRIPLLPNHSLQPAAPYVGPGMDDDVCTQVSAPGCQRSEENPQHADHDHIDPALIGVKQTKHHTLRHHCHDDVSTQGMKLLLQESSKSEKRW